MNALFNPKSIAVVGASHHPEKAGHILFYNLLRSFRGNVYPVNIKGGEILGKKVYQHLSDLPEVPDLVVIAVPSPVVPSVLEEAGRLGVKAAVIVSGGFGEVGRKDLDEKVREIAMEYHISVVGPNCIGVYTPEMNATFLSPDRMDFPGRGGVSLLSQSGAVVAAILDIFSREGIGVSKVVSLGNKLLLDEVDFLEFLENDPSTDAIVLYLEGIARGRKLYETVKRISKSKPVIVLKGGKTKRGGKAASSHTEALLNDYEVFRGAMRQAGAIEVNNTKEMVDVLLALMQPLPKGRKMLILTNGGGFGVMATDFAELYGFELPDWGEPLDLPPHVVQSNPFDLTGDATPEWYEMVLQSASDYDLAVVIIAPQTPKIDLSIVRSLQQSPVPVYAYVPGWKYAQLIREKLIEAGIPAYESLDAMMNAVSKVVDYSRRRLL